jgi:hypothetical protein
MDASSGPDVHVMAADDGSALPATVATDASLAGWTPDGRGLLLYKTRNGVTELHLMPVALV